MSSINTAIFMLAIATSVMAVATIIMAVVTLESLRMRGIREAEKPEEAEEEAQEEEAEEVDEEAQEEEVEVEEEAEEAEATVEEEAQEAEADAQAETTEELYRITVPSGHEMALKKKGPHISIGLVESGNGQVFRVIPLTTGTFAGAIKIQAVGGFADGKVLDNYKQKNDHLCLYKTSRDNNRAQNWKKDGNKLISMTTGKLQLKVNEDSIGFSKNGDDIIFIPA